MSMSDGFVHVGVSLDERRGSVVFVERGRNVGVFLASGRKPCNNSRCAALWSPSLSCSFCFYF